MMLLFSTQKSHSAEKGRAQIAKVVGEERQSSQLLRVLQIGAHTACNFFDSTEAAGRVRSKFENAVESAGRKQLNWLMFLHQKPEVSCFTDSGN
jgi:hypothetical protein